MIWLVAAVAVVTGVLVVLVRKVMALEDAVLQLQEAVIELLDPEHETRGQADT